MKVRAYCIVIVACVLSMAAAVADDANVGATNSVSTTPLIEVLDHVRRQTGRVFLVDRRVESDIVTGQLKSGEIDYSSLLLLLRNNGLAANARTYSPTRTGEPNGADLATAAAASGPPRS